MHDFFLSLFLPVFSAFFSSFDSAFMQNSITFMGPFIVQNSQQRCYSAGRFGHFLEGKRPGKCQTWPQYNEDLWTCLGAIRASIAMDTTIVENQKKTTTPTAATNQNFTKECFFYLILTSLESHSPCRSKAISIEAISCKIQVLQNVQT